MDQTGTTGPGVSPMLFKDAGKESAEVLAGALDRLTGVLREALASPRRIEFQNCRGSVEGGAFVFDGVVVIGPPKEGL